MGKIKELSIEERSLIALHKLKKSNREIALKLNIPRRMVDYNVKKYSTTKSFVNRKRTGRPRKTTTAQDNYIALSSRHNRRLTAPEITAQVNKSRHGPLVFQLLKEDLSKRAYWVE